MRSDTSARHAPTQVPTRGHVVASLPFAICATACHGALDNAGAVPFFPPRDAISTASGVQHVSSRERCCTHVLVHLSTIPHALVTLRRHRRGMGFAGLRPRPHRSSDQAPHAVGSSHASLDALLAHSRLYGMRSVSHSQLPASHVTTPSAALSGACRCSMPMLNSIGIVVRV